MKLNATIFRLLPLLALLQAGLYSCDTIHEDLPPAVITCISVIPII